MKSGPKAKRRRIRIEDRLALSDPALGRVIDAVMTRIGTQRIASSRAAPFEALLRAVLYQGVSGKAGASIFARLKATVKGPLTPSKVVVLPSRSLSRAGLSKAKLRAIRNLAAWFMSHRKLAKSLPTLPDEEIVARLTAIPGIGAWTVNVFLIFNLGRLDVMPAADLGIRRGVQLADRLRALPTTKQVLERSRTWQPYRSIASIYLWQAGKLKLGAKDVQE